MVASLNLGTYYGDGNSLSSSRVSGASTRNATSSNIRSLSRDIQAGYSSDIELIQKYLKSGKTDKAIEVYEGLTEDLESSASNYRYEINEAQIQSALKTAFEQTTGSSLVDCIDKNTSGSFMTGFKQSIPIFGLFANDTSEAEALAKLTGEEVSFKDKALEFLGMAAGTALFWWLGGSIGKGLQVAGKALGILNTAEKGAKILAATGNTKKVLDCLNISTKAVGTGLKYGDTLFRAAAAATTAVNAAEELTDEFSENIFS